MLAFLLHAANRNIKSENDDIISAFYNIKDILLKNYGTLDGYDIQHIKGKKCNSCGGRGQHPRHSNRPPYKIYDWADCYHCWGGWYRLPKWICLQRIKFGGYNFHKPLKRHECVKNPFTKEDLGWEVTDRPVIEGYIEHNDHWVGEWAIIILLAMYGEAKMARELFDKKIYWRKIHWRNKIKNLSRWQAWIFWKPTWRTQYETDGEDLPF